MRKVRGRVFLYLKNTGIGAWRMENGLDVRYRIGDLQADMCRWITCDTPFEQEYCGNETFKKSCYCQAHYEICYAKKHNTLASVPNLNQSTVAIRPRPSIQIKRLQYMDFRGRQCVPDPKETSSTNPDH